MLTLLVAGAGACSRAETDTKATPDEPAKKPPKKADHPPPPVTARTPEKHRESGTPCPREATRETHGPRMRTPDGPPCTANADCKEQKNGRCSASGFCSYDSCYADADCGKGGVCVCTEEGKRGYACVMGNCSVDGDCKGERGNGYCSPTYGLSCGPFTGTIGWYCHTKDDDCVDDGDCAKPGKGARGYCAWSPEASKWVCGYGQCVG
jgi:hypothetical protein